MPIQFPKLHIAQSVLNRIQNTLEETGPLGVGNKALTPPAFVPPPSVPDPTALGMAIDEKVEQPVAPAEVPPGTEEDANNGMLEASVMGGSPFDGALSGI